MVLSELDQLSRDDKLSLAGNTVISLLGVLVLGWSAYALFVLYWAETGVALLFAVVYAVLFDVGDEEPAPDGKQHFDPSWGTLRRNVNLVQFTVIFGGLFWAGLGVMLYGLSDASNGLDAASMGTVLGIVSPALVVVAVGSLGRLRLNRTRTGNRQRERVLTRIAEPLNRIIVLFLFIFVGGWLTLFLGSPTIPVLLVFLAVKLWMDVWIELNAGSDSADDGSESTGEESTDDGSESTGEESRPADESADSASGPVESTDSST